MTIHLPEDLERSVLDEVRSGRFPSEDAVVAAAVRDFLRRQGDHGVGAAEGDPEPDSQALQRRLLAAGLVSEIKPPIADLTPYLDRRAVPIQGEPISETAIRERR